jgi:antitoxin VapB
MVESAYNSTMALNIKDGETEKLVAEVAEMTGNTKTGAVREALREKRDRLALQRSGRPRTVEEITRFLETEIWPLIPEEERGGPPMTKEEVEEMLGIGPEGV